MGTLPTLLAERMRLRQVVLVAGSRCSELVQFPDWRTLGERLLALVDDAEDRDGIEKLLTSGRALAGFGRLRETVHEELVAEAVREAFPVGAQVPAAVLAAARVPWRAVISTSFDDLWARALGAGGGAAPPIVVPGQGLDLDEWRGGFLLHVFGHVGALGALCLCPRDARAKVSGTPTGALLGEAWKRWSFVFVGFAPGDPDLALLAERLLGAAPSEGPHFLLLPGGDPAEARALRADLGFFTVPLEGDTEAALGALGEAWSEMEASARPPEDDVEAWFDLWGRDADDPEPPAVIARAAERLRAEAKWEPLVALLVQRTELVKHPRDQVADLRAVGRIFDEQMKAPDRALSVLTTALKLDPGNRDLLGEVKTAARRARQWDEFVKDLETLVDEQGDAATLDHWLELARARGDKGRRDDTIRAFEKVLSLAPDSAEAQAALEDLYRAGERWRDLARILGERERRAADPHEARGLRHARAELLIDKLGDTEGAIQVLEAQVAADPASETALRRLAQIHEKRGDDRALLAVLERLVPLAKTEDERRTMLVRVGHLLRSLTDARDRVAAAFVQAFSLGEKSPEVLDYLAHAYEDGQDWESLVQVLERRAEHATDAHARAGLRARAAAVLSEKLREQKAAEDLFARALEDDPDNVAVLAAMAAISRGHGDNLRAAKFLHDGAERTRNPLDRARLIHEAATLYDQQLGDEDRALLLYQQALAADPEHIAAAERVAAILERRGQWEALEPVLDVLVLKADAARPETADLHRRVAECARRLGKADKAHKSFEAAKTLAPDSVPALRALAEMAFDKQAWAEARDHYRALRSAAGRGLGIPERTAINVRLGRCESALGDHEGAVRSLEAAVALDPPVEEKAQLIEEIADLYQQRLERPDRAIRMLQDVLSLQPGRRQAQHKLLDLFTSQKRWSDAADTLDRLAAIESDPGVRSKYRYAAASIYRDEIKDPARAVELYSGALDDNPELIKAFDSVERLLIEAGDAKGLARHYRKMLKRLPAEGQTELKSRLWHALGTVSIEDLGDREAAVVAFEVACSLDPSNLQRNEQLARLYLDAGPGALDKAIAQHQLLVARQPERLDYYRALASLYQQTQQFDKLWCVAAALAYLGDTDHTLLTFWQRYRSSEVPVAAGKLTQELWHRLVHPSENRLIDAIFSLLAPTLAIATAQSHQSVGVKRNDRVDMNRDDWFPAVALKYLAGVLEVQLPDVFVREKDPLSVGVANLREKEGLTPALVIGKGFERWTSQWEVVFDLAKRACFLRWERYPRIALGTPAALDIALRAALTLGGVAVGHGQHDGEVEKTSRRLAEVVPRPLADQLVVVARKFFESHKDNVDVSTWIAAADLTATRAAFVLSSDLPSAARVLEAEAAGLSPMPLLDRMKDLLAFSVSDDFFAVREALGLRVV